MNRVFSHNWIAVFIIVLCIWSTLGRAEPVFLNQVGYLTKASKTVLVPSGPDSFTVRNQQTGQVEFEGAFSAYTEVDQATGITAASGDFTDLQMPGRYYIVTSTNDTSAAFTISDSVYLPVFKSALKGFYFQRCGTALTSEYAGEYTHDECHPMDGVLHVSTDTSGFINSHGGWHDAGDFGKYVVNAGVSVGTMLMAYEYYPQRFYHDDLGIPESGNGIPDILDELRYELEWLMTMQNVDGGVFHKLTSKNFSGVIMPENHSDTRYIYEISSTGTADFSAMMARAARVFGPWDLEFAQEMFIRAQAAWNYLEAHPSIVPPGGYQNPGDTQTGEYGDGNDADERLWAAAELYASTGEAEYRDYFEDHYQDIQVFSRGFGWPSVGVLADLTYLLADSTAASGAIALDLLTAFRAACDWLVTNINQSQFRTALSPGEYNWGSNSGALNRAVMLAIGFEYFADSTYYQGAQDQLHYVLGKNIHDMSFVTGVGTHSPMHIHHRPSQADGIDAPVPGLIAGGPNQYLQDSALQGAFDENTPPARCYLDVWDSYASNEIAINWNAPLVFLAGFFTLPDTTFTGIDGGTSSTIPQGIRLEQNYPNPFNGSTRFEFTLNEAQQVTLVIYNLRGETVEKTTLGYLNSGRHIHHWDGAGHDANNLSSGVYFYRMEGRNFSEMRKLVLLK